MTLGKRRYLTSCESVLGSEGIQSVLRASPASNRVGASGKQSSINSVTALVFLASVLALT